MSIKRTTWGPDTCDCIVEYEWDDAIAQGSRTHTISNIINKCPAHTSLSTNTDVWNALNDENPRKNAARGLLLENGPTSLYDVIDATNGTREFKNGITFNWSWTGSGAARTLTITVTGITLTTQQRNTVQTVLNNRFGSGKVTLG